MIKSVLSSCPRNWVRKFSDTLTFKRFTLANDGEVRFVQHSESKRGAASLEFLYVREKKENIEVSQHISNHPTMLWPLFISVKVNT